MTGKRRTNLSIKNLESLVKIHSYYITNRTSELNLYNQKHTTEDTYQELYNAQLNKEEEEENKNEIKNQLNINLDNYDLDDNKETI